MQQTDFAKLLADTLAAQGRSPRTQETYTLMLRLFARYLGRADVDKTLDSVESLVRSAASQRSTRREHAISLMPASR